MIFNAGLGVIVTSWRLGLIKPYKAFQGLLIYSMYYIYIYIYIYVLLYKAHKAYKPYKSLKGLIRPYKALSRLNNKPYKSL